MLATIVDIKRFLEADRDQPHRIRAERDSGIGQQLGEAAQSADADRLRRVLGWWQVVKEQRPADVTTDAAASGDQLVRVRQLTNSASVLLGVVLGMSLTTAALTYTGDYPVNLLTLLGVLVLLPLLMLALTLLGLLPLRGITGFADALAGMNPVVWLGSWLQQRIGWSAATLPGWRRLARWQLVLTSQLMAVAFFIAALLTLLLLVALSDLAFGWSTTLSVSPESLASVLQTLSWPWQALWPAAVPSTELVTNSQFFRLDFQTPDLATAAGFGAWWPFVLICIACYGLLPRLALLAIAAGRTNKAEQRLLLRDPDVTALLDRMDAQPLQALSKDAPLNTLPANNATSKQAQRSQAQRGAAALIIWNDASTAVDARALAANLYGFDATSVSTAHPGDDPRAVANTLTNETRAIVVTKGWEPPLLEFTDFLAELIQAAPTLNSLVVLPRSLDGAGVGQDDARIWSGAVEQLADSRIITLQATTLDNADNTGSDNSTEGGTA